MRRAAKRDANEAEIIDALRAAGCHVIQADDIDLIVGRAGKNYLIEVKLPKKRDNLRPIQQRMKAEWCGQYCIVTTPAEALHAVGANDER